MSTDTNIYPIQGLDGLTVGYDVYKIVGLVPGTPGYFNNIQTLIGRLSRMLKEPVTTLSRDGVAHIVIPSEAGSPPVVSLTGAVATMEPTGETVEIDFSKRDELDSIRQRFLQFSIQAPMKDKNELWQPRSGQAFFAKKPEKTLGELSLYRGVSLRVVPTPSGGWGVCVDIKTKLVRSKSLPENVDAALIRRLKGQSCVYRFGHQWFEVTLEGLADYDISQPVIPEDGKALSVLDYVMRHSRKPMPDRLANLDPSGAAIFYRTEGPTPKNAPAGLCFAVEDAHTKLGARNHRQAILPPHIRKKRSGVFVSKYLSRFSLRNVVLAVESKPIENTNETFPVPAFEFGNGKTISFGYQATGGENRPLKALGSDRVNLMSDHKVGFHSNTPLGRQYIVLPRSISGSSGQEFINALKEVVRSLYRAGKDYDPILIEYDDTSSKRGFIEQGQAIKAAMEAQTLVAGHALVMIHDVPKRKRDVDPLEAMIVKDFPSEFGLKASVIHTNTVRRVYQYSDNGAKPKYSIHPKEVGRYRSYLRNVALSKVLMTSGKKPFVLSGRTKADFIVGIDVKNNTAAFSLIAGGGRIAHSKTWNSRKRERLTEDQVAAYFKELIVLEKNSFDEPPAEIVVHRDGRVFESEIAGLERACSELARDGILADDWRLTVLEIRKTGPVTMRFFDSVFTPDTVRIENPLVGTWIGLTEEEGFVTTTGFPFRRQGTAQPLHVIRKSGDLSIKDCLQDVFDLSCLSWSSPDNGIRVPISIKLCDRVLFEDAADYDVDALAHAPAANDEARS